MIRLASENRRIVVGIFAEWLDVPADGNPPRCDLIWKRFLDFYPTTTPEGRAELDVALHAFIETIPLGLREHYRAFFRARRAGAFTSYPMAEISV